MDHEARKVVISGKTLHCQHCGGDHFLESHAQLNTAVMTFFNMDWLNRSAIIYQCHDCGRLEWFLAPLEASASIARSNVENAFDCLNCGAIIPAGKAACPQCQWSYQ